MIALMKRKHFMIFKSKPFSSKLNKNKKTKLVIILEKNYLEH